MCGPAAVPIAIGAAGALGAGASIISANKQRKAQKEAAARAQREAAKAEAANRRMFNQANQKQPNLSAIIAANQANAGGGIGSTMLTGPGGAGGGLLGRATLLGG